MVRNCKDEGVSVKGRERKEEKGTMNVKGIKETGMIVVRSREQMTE